MHTGNLRDDDDLMRVWGRRILPWRTHCPKAEVAQECHLVEVARLFEGPVMMKRWERATMRRTTKRTLKSLGRKTL